MRRRAHVPAAIGGSNPNLLTAPEDFADAAWTAVGVTVTTNPGGSTRTGADGLVFAGGTLTEVSAVTAASGSASLSITLATGSVRYAVSGTFDGTAYTGSLELEPDPPSVDLTLQLQLVRLGGFLAFRLRDIGDNPSVFAWGAKLEHADHFSEYP